MRENLLDLVVMSCGAAGRRSSGTSRPEGSILMFSASCAGRWRMALSIFNNMRFVQVGCSPVFCVVVQESAAVADSAPVRWFLGSWPINTL